MGHLANSCPNKEKLKLKKEEERLKHVKCFKYHDWGHLTLSCPTKQLVKQQENPQPKPQVEQKKTPQDQVKINNKDQVDDLKMMKKKRTRRCGKRARHPMHIQDAKMMSKNKIQEKMMKVAHIKCHSCATLGHLDSGCPNKFENKAQANNEKHQMSKKEKAQQKRRCYLCRKRGHMANSCPLGNILSLFQLMQILCLERMVMVPHWLLL